MNLPDWTTFQTRAANVEVTDDKVRQGCIRDHLKPNATLYADQAVGHCRTADTGLPYRDPFTTSGMSLSAGPKAQQLSDILDSIFF